MVSCNKSKIYLFLEGSIDAGSSDWTCSLRPVFGRFDHRSPQTFASHQSSPIATTHSLLALHGGMIHQRVRRHVGSWGQEDRRYIIMVARFSVFENQGTTRLGRRSFERAICHWFQILTGSLSFCRSVQCNHIQNHEKKARENSLVAAVASPRDAAHSSNHLSISLFYTVARRVSCPIIPLLDRVSHAPTFYTSFLLIRQRPSVVLSAICG
jgi:hypothetical protein